MTMDKEDIVAAVEEGLRTNYIRYEDGRISQFGQIISAKDLIEQLGVNDAVPYALVWAQFEWIGDEQAKAVSAIYGAPEVDKLVDIVDRLGDDGEWTVDGYFELEDEDKLAVDHIVSRITAALLEQTLAQLFIDPEAPNPN